MFFTHMAYKYLVRIETEPKVTISDLILDVTAVKEALSDLIDLPNGKLDEIGHIGNLLVLMWDFDDYTLIAQMPQKTTS